MPLPTKTYVNLQPPTKTYNPSKNLPQETPTSSA